MVGRIHIVESRLDMLYTFLDANKVGVVTFEHLSNALGYEVFQQNIIMQNMKIIINHNSGSSNASDSNIHGSSNGSSNSSGGICIGGGGGMNERSLSKR